MPILRRTLLAVVPAAALAAPARAQDVDTRAPRFVGSPDAKVVVDEYFSMTCPHCAAFSQQTLPEIEKNLIETGAVKWVYHDYPLDQVAMTASMIARYLPVDRYEPFINALFATQNKWAFARGADTTAELWKIAGLAGMSRATFDKAVADNGLRDWIADQQRADTRTYSIDSTPTFVVNGKKYAGEMSYEAFRKLIPV
jgi:protein-disulfide isomerase